AVAARRGFYRFLRDAVRDAASFSLQTNPADAAAGVAGAQANPPQLIVRDSAGKITDVYRAPINLSSQFIEGIDFRVRYSFEYADLGNFTASLAGNYYTRWDYLPDEFSAMTSAIGMQNADTSLSPPMARYKANASLNWYRGDHAAAVTVRHVAKLKFDQITLTTGYEHLAPETIRPTTKVDARYSYRFNAFGTDSNVTVGLLNVFDRDAQRLPHVGGLETRIDDPFGRQFYVSWDFEM